MSKKAMGLVIFLAMAGMAVSEAGAEEQGYRSAIVSNLEHAPEFGTPAEEPARGGVTMQIVSPLIHVYSLTLGRDGSWERGEALSQAPGEGLEFGVSISRNARLTLLLHDAFRYDEERGGYELTRNLRIFFGPSLHFGEGSFRWFLNPGLAARYLSEPALAGGSGPGNTGASLLGGVSVMTGPELHLLEGAVVGFQFSLEHFFIFSDPARRSDSGNRSLLLDVSGGVFLRLSH